MKQSLGEYKQTSDRVRKQTRAINTEKQLIIAKIKSNPRLNLILRNLGIKPKAKPTQKIRSKTLL